MAEQRNPQDPVGTVAEEAAKLVEALGGWAQSARAGRRPGEGAASGHDQAPAGHDTDHAAAGHATDQAPAGHGLTGHCEHCGAANGTGQAIACQLCPVCQGIALLRAVRPETVDRLADLAAALSATLREVAADRRESRGGSDPQHRSDQHRSDNHRSDQHRSDQHRSSRVQDIDIDEDLAT